MGIRFTCPQGHKLNVKSFLAGKKGFCPHCNARVDIPLESTRPSRREEQATTQPMTAAPASQSIRTEAEPTTPAADASAPAGAQATTAAGRQFEDIAAHLDPPQVQSAASQSAASQPAASQPSATSPAAAVSATPAVATPTAATPTAATPVAATPETATPVAAAPAAAQPVTSTPTESVASQSVAIASPTAEATTETVAEPVWYVRPRSGGQYGPTNRQMVDQWIEEGRVADDTYVWCEGWPTWQLASYVFPKLQVTQDEIHIAVRPDQSAAEAAGPQANEVLIRAASETETDTRVIRRRKNGNSVWLVAVLSVVAVILVVVLIFVLAQ